MAPTAGRGLSGNMRRLHVVGFSAEHGGFVLAARKGAKSGGFLLPLDASLRAEFERAREAQGGHQPGGVVAQRSAVQSGLTPREIQARLRSGRTIEEVAHEAGATTDWVERFAAPVLAEQRAAVERAGRATLLTPRKGPSERTLEASLARNLAERGLSMTDEEMQGAWSARHLVDTDWLISFRFRSRGRSMTAEWLLNGANGALTAHNRLGTDLGYIDPGRRMAAALPPVGQAGPSSPSRRARRRTVRKVAAKRAVVPKVQAPEVTPAKVKKAAKVTAVAKAPAAKVAQPATPGRKAAAEKATVVRAPVRRTAANRPAPAAAASASAPKAPAPKAGAPKRAVPKRATPKATAKPAADSPTPKARRAAKAPASGTSRIPAARPRGAHYARDPQERRAAGPVAAPVTPAPTAAGTGVPTDRSSVPAVSPARTGPSVPGSNGHAPARANRPLRADRNTTPPLPPPAGHDDGTPDSGGIRLARGD